MKTIKSITDKAAFLDVACEYSVVIITKNDSENAYGIAARDASEVNMCIKEIGADKELALSILEILNNYKVPFVHFPDVVNDLMNE